MPKIGQIVSSSSKQCTVCKIVKLRTEFYRHPAGVQALCKECHKKDCAARAQRRIRRQRDSNDVLPLVKAKLQRSSREAKLHGYVFACTTPLEDLVNSYSTVCRICGKDVGHSICLDHCHETGIFRGWLCGNCNIALGYAQENPEILRKMADYLEEQYGDWQA